MFGNNQSVMTSSTIFHSGLYKRHNAILYHCVCEVFAIKTLGFFHVDSKMNAGDVLSKHCSFWQAWLLVKPLLFLMGDTLECDVKGDKMKDIYRKAKVKED